MNANFLVLVLVISALISGVYQFGYSAGYEDASETLDPYQYYWYGMNDLLNFHTINLTNFELIVGREYQREFPDGGIITFHTNGTWSLSENGSFDSDCKYDILADKDDPWTLCAQNRLIENSSFDVKSL